MSGNGGAVVRTLASHQCGLGLNLGADAICALSLLLVLFLASRDFSPGTPVSPLLKNQQVLIPFDLDTFTRVLKNSSVLQISLTITN